MSNSVLVIAEAGINHNGSAEAALKLVEVAASAGADAIKFQTFTAAALAIEGAGLVAYQQAQGTIRTQREMLSGLELDRTTHQLLAKEAQRNGLIFLSTAFDIPSLQLLDAFDLPILKVPSGEITNLPYLREIGKRLKPVLLSTGMSDMLEIQDAIDAMCETGLSTQDITVLHCTSCYPCAYDQVNLRALQTLQNTLNVKVGYSDHTLGYEVASAAVALGATTLEKHITLDRSLSGPDHQASADPREFADYVSAVRRVEQALGRPHKTPQPCEKEARMLVRKSIVTSRKIQKGETLTQHNLTTKRPGTGLSPMQWDDVMGRLATRDYDENEILDA